MTIDDYLREAEELGDRLNFDDSDEGFDAWLAFGSLIRMLRLAIDDRNALLNQFYDGEVPAWEIENRESELLAIAKGERE